MTQGYISDNVEWFKKEIIDIANNVIKLAETKKLAKDTENFERYIRIICALLNSALFEEAKEKCTMEELEACSNFCKQYAEEPRYFSNKNSIDLSSWDSYEAFRNVFKNMQIALYNFTNPKIKLDDDLPDQEEIYNWFMIELSESLRIILEQWKLIKTHLGALQSKDLIKHHTLTFVKKAIQKHDSALCLTLFVKILELRLTRNPNAQKGAELDIRNIFLRNIKQRFEDVIKHKTQRESCSDVLQPHAGSSNENDCKMNFKTEEISRYVIHGFNNECACSNFTWRWPDANKQEDIYKPGDRVCFVAHRQAAYLYPQVPEQASQFNDNFYLGIVEDCNPNRMGEKTCKLKNAFYIVGSDIIDMLTSLNSRHVDEIIGSKDFNEKQFIPVKQKDPVRENHDGLTTLYGKILLKTIDEKHFPKLNKMLCVYAEELQVCDENDCDED